MSHRPSPIAIFEPKPHEVCLTRKQTKERVRSLNNRATTNEYWFVLVKVIPEESYAF